MQRGRKPGYKHSDETKDKIRQGRQGKGQDEETRSKISKSMRGRSKNPEHREALSDSLRDLERKCMRRFLELKAEYPGHEDFFEAHKSEILFAMRSIKSEKELRDIRKYFETVPIEYAPENVTSYQYASSSCYAQEDAMIALLDAASFLRKFRSTNTENPTIH
ncbi:MAG: hypothetical protein GF334_01525 [Candidatus Altiarchaeales archaeon]|nr:hypothetical protein [Candidatus Altiarchaeales archaeon]